MGISVSSYNSPYAAWYTPKQRKKRSESESSESDASQPLDEFFENRAVEVEEVLEFRKRHQMLMDFTAAATASQIMKQALVGSEKDINSIDNKNQKNITSQLMDIKFKFNAGIAGLRNFFKRATQKTQSEILGKIEKSFEGLLESMALESISGKKSAEQIKGEFSEEFEKMWQELQSLDEKIDSESHQLISRSETKLREEAEVSTSFIKKIAGTINADFSAGLFRHLRNDIRSQLS